MLLTSSKRGSTNVFACNGVLILLFLLLVLSIAASRCALAQHYAVKALGGETDSVPLAINNAGLVVGSTSQSGGVGCLWDKAGFHLLWDLPGIPFGTLSQSAYAVNSKGQVLFTDGLGDVYLYGYYDHTLSFLQFGASIAFVYYGPSVTVSAINDLGDVVGAKSVQLTGGGYVYADAVFWDGTVHDLGRFGNGSPIAVINNSLDMASTGFVHHGVGPLMASDLVPALNNVYITAINNHGEIVGDIFSTTSSQAVLYSGGTVTNIPSGAYAYGINDSGVVVGQTVDNKPYIYDSIHGLQDPNTLIGNNSGWTINSVNAINKIGQIAGTGYSSTYGGPIILTPVNPSPPTTPVLNSPGNDAVVSPLPTFTLKAFDPGRSKLTYTIQVTNAATNTVFATYTTAATPSGNTASFSVETLAASPQPLSIPAGSYTWSAYATDVFGVSSQPSASQSFTVFGGVDLDTTVAPDTFFSQLSAAGWSFVIVDAWGGHTNVPGAAAEANLAAALSPNPLGPTFKVAAYCLLNFDNKATTDALGRKGAKYVPKNQTGDWQMQQAFTAIADPSLISQLAFMAIDVETMSVAKGVDPAGRITEALTELALYNATNGTNIPAVIYTRYGEWNAIVGTYSPSQANNFGSYPLWWINIGGDELATNWAPFYGWKGTPSGKQYKQDKPLYGMLKVDRDVFDPTMFP